MKKTEQTDPIFYWNEHHRPLSLQSRIYSAGGGAARQSPQVSTSASPMRKRNDIIVEGYIYRSRQNGAVFNAGGVSPTLTIGHHSGVEPKIIVYEDL